MSYITTCPHCHAKNALYVVKFTAFTKIPLSRDGFAWSDGKYADSEDEIVECDSCGEGFPLDALYDE